ncbi:MAG: hypothetical protein Q7S16_04530, partial [bacterium]|nr:hypothetical protein [bacterium]
MTIAISIKEKLNYLKRHYFPEAVTLIVIFGVMSAFMGIYASTNRSSMPIPYQGRLLNSNSIAVPDGTYYMKFAIYTAATSTESCVWESGSSTGASNCNSGTSATMPVSITSGQFTALLGSTGTNNPAIPSSSINFESNAYYLGITICGTDNVCTNAQMTPRRQLGGTPYAYNTDTLDGLDSAALAILAGQSGGQTLKGGTAASENLTLMSTVDSVKGKIFMGTSAYDELNNRFGIGTTTPIALLSLGNPGVTAGTLSMAGSTSGIVTLDTPAAAGTWTWRLPSNAGTSTYTLTTDGNGTSTWAQVNLASGVTSTLPLANGGMNTSLTASNGGIFYSTATTGAILSGTATAGQILRSGSSDAPSWSTATFPTTAGSANNALVSDGTNWASTAIVNSATGTASRITTSANTGSVTFDIASTYVGQTSITTLGTVATGTWSGLFGAVTGANLTSLTAANISAGTSTGLNIGGNAGTVTNGVYTTGSYSNPAWITNLDGSKVTGTIAGSIATAAGLTGTPAITVAALIATTGAFTGAISTAYNSGATGIVFDGYNNVANSNTEQTQLRLRGLTSSGNVHGVIFESQGIDSNYGRLNIRLKTVASANDTDSYYTNAISITRASDTTANVGIGTTTPQTKLQVVEAAGAHIASFKNSDANARIEIMSTATGGKSWIINQSATGGIAEAGSLLFRMDTATQINVMTLGATGNVGIGTTTPQDLLHISRGGSADAAIRLENTTASTGRTWIINSRPDNGQFEIYDYTALASRFRIDSSGTSTFGAVTGTGTGAVYMGALSATTGGFSGAVTINVAGGGLSSALMASSTAPAYGWYESDQAANARYWDQLVDGGVMNFRVVQDDNNGALSWMTATRTGIASVATAIPGTLSTGALTATGILRANASGVAIEASDTGGANNTYITIGAGSNGIYTGKNGSGTLQALRLGVNDSTTVLTLGTDSTATFVGALTATTGTFSGDMDITGDTLIGSRLLNRLANVDLKITSRGTGKIIFENSSNTEWARISDAGIATFNYAVNTQALTATTGTFSTSLSITSSSGSPFFIDSTGGVVSPIVEYKVAGSTVGYIGFAGAIGGVVNSSAVGDAVIRTASKEFIVTNDSGTTKHFKVSSTGAGTFAAGLTATTGTFSGATTITSAGTPLIVTASDAGQSEVLFLKHSTNTVGALSGLIFNLNDSVATDIAYAGMYAKIITNTTTVADGELNFYTRLAGTFTNTMTLAKNGALNISAGLSATTGGFSGNLTLSGSGANITGGATAATKFTISADNGVIGEMGAGVHIQTAGGSALNLFADGTAGSAAGKVQISYYTTAWKSAVEISNTASASYGNLLLMKSGGNVGIGTTTPSTKLQVSGDGYVNSYRGVIRIDNTGAGKWSGIAFPDSTSAADSAANNYYFMGRGEAIADRTFSIHMPTATDYGSGNQPVFGIYSTNADQLFRVQASTGETYIKGSVGIGTTTPGGKLDVTTSAAGVAAIFGNASTVDRLKIYDFNVSPNTPSLLFGDGSGWKFHIGKSSDSGVTKFVTFQDDGKVGIGTVGPQTKLHIYTNATGETEALRLQGKYGASGDGPLLRFTNYHASGLVPNAGEYNLAGILGADDGGGWGGKLQFQTAPGPTLGGVALQTRMVIMANGNVGIGTTTPATQLQLYTTSNNLLTLTAEHGMEAGDEIMSAISFQSPSEAYVNNDDAWKWKIGKVRLSDD